MKPKNCTPVAVLLCVLAAVGAAQNLEAVIQISNNLGGLSAPQQVLPNPLSGCVYVNMVRGLLRFNPATMTKLSPIDVGCYDMFYCLPANRLLFTDFAGVVAIDGAADTLVDSVMIPGVKHFAWSPTSGMMYVTADMTADYISVYDPVRDSVVGQVNVDTFDFGVMAWDSLSDRLVVSARVSSDSDYWALAMFDCRTDSLVALETMPWSVTAMTACPRHGRLYASDGSGTLLACNVASRAVADTLRVGTANGALLYDPVTDRLYCPVPGDTLLVFDAGSDSLRARTHLPVVAALSANPVTGVVYAATGRDSGIAVLDTGGALTRWIRTASCGDPSVMGFSTGRNELYSAMDLDTVAVIDAAADTVSRAIDYTEYSIRGMARNAASARLYLMVPNHGRVLVYSPDNELVDEIPVGLHSGTPFPVTDTSRDRLYIADAGGLWVIDCGADTLVGWRPMPGVQSGLPIPVPSTHELYVFPRTADSGQCCAWVYDCEADSVERSIPLPGRVPCAAYHPASNRVYFSTNTSNGLVLGAIDPASGNTVLWRRMGNATTDTRMFADADNGRLYFADNRLNNFYAIDVADESIVHTLHFQRDIDTIFQHRALNRLYLCYRSSTRGQVRVYDCALDSIIRCDTTPFRYVGAIVETPRHLWVGGGGGVGVVSCETGGNLMTLPGVTNPRYSAVFDIADRVYFAGYSNYFARYGDIYGAVEEEASAHTPAPLVAVGNPAREHATLRCAVPAGQRAVLSVHDIAGRVVGRREFTGRTGPVTVTWPEAGTRMPAGVYFARLGIGGSRSTVKLVLE